MNKEELYEAYKKQCKDNGTRPVSMNKYFEVIDSKEQLEEQEKKENINKLEWLLEEKEMSVYRLAREIGESDQTTRNIVKGEFHVKTYRTLRKIADTLGMDAVDDLFWDE